MNIFTLIYYQYKMTQHNTLNVKLSNSKFKKLTLGIKNDNEVTLEISSNIVDDSSDEDNFLHKLSLSNAQSLLKL